jgi:hypothetical protein
MTSNCSRFPLKPLDPAIDPAYQDGPPPRPHRTKHSGELLVEWPFATIPEPLRKLRTISIEALEDQLEREAKIEERYT